MYRCILFLVFTEFFEPKPIAKIFESLRSVPSFNRILRTINVSQFVNVTRATLIFLIFSITIFLSSLLIICRISCISICTLIVLVHVLRLVDLLLLLLSILDLVFNFIRDSHFQFSFFFQIDYESSIHRKFGSELKILATNFKLINQIKKI